MAPDAVDARPGRGRRLAVAGTALVLAAVTVAGAGYTAVTVRDADRSPGAPTLALPKAGQEKKAGQAPAPAGAAGLAQALVPYRNDAWSRGPDLGEFGSDATLSGAQATALRKESLTGLPRSERKELEKAIDRRHITGMVMRNYAGGGHFTDDGQTGAATVTIVLSRMGNRSAVRDMATRQNDFFAAMDLFREGPRIKGHKDAKCFRLSAETDQELDMVFCAAYEGDVLVTVTADSVRPLDTESFTELVTEQLDRIAEPGESV
ncbi:secreted protein [Streptomyces sp. KO7888]|nr:secreted protein [Streptomyces sp. KO7888]